MSSEVFYKECTAKMFAEALHLTWKPAVATQNCIGLRFVQILHYMHFSCLIFDEIQHMTPGTSAVGITKATALLQNDRE